MRRLNHDTCRMAFHNSIEHEPHSPRVIPGGHEHNGSDLMLIAPRWKHLAFTFRSSLSCRGFPRHPSHQATSVGEFAVRPHPRKGFPAG